MLRILCALLPVLCASGADDVAIEFFPPLSVADEADRAALRQVKGEVAVVADDEVGETTVEGAGAQDAINGAIAEGVGCRRVEFPSGFGYVATAKATYAASDNLTMTRIAKRDAYLRAHAAAKVALAKKLRGLSVAAREEIRAGLAEHAERWPELAAFEARSEESLDAAARALFRGLVVYDVRDDVDAGRVTVAVVTTPKTRARARRLDAFRIEAGDLDATIERELALIRAGVVPPVGGTIVGLRDGPGYAFVGFGSSVVRRHDDPDTAGKLRTAARRHAALRAKASLIGMIAGDFASWKKDLDEARVRELEVWEREEFDDDAAEDFDRARAADATRLTTTTTVRGLRRGEVPDDVRVDAWLDDDGGIAYAVAIWVPAADESDDAGGAVAADPPPAGIAPGPTGQVTEDEDL